MGDAIGMLYCFVFFYIKNMFFLVSKDYEVPTHVTPSIVETTRNDLQGNSQIWRQFLVLMSNCITVKNCVTDKYCIGK